MDSTFPQASYRPEGRDEISGLLLTQLISSPRVDQSDVLQ